MFRITRYFFLGEKQHDPDKALHEAHLHLEKIQNRSKEVREITTSLRTLREQNHFAQKLQAIMEGR